MRQITIGGKVINDDSDAFTIAEIGHNHGGNLDTCKEMFRVAKECGASAVKLQKRNNRKLFTKEMYNAPYDNENSYGKTYGEHREALEFGRKEYVVLKKYARDLGITFFATAFDIASADFLYDLDMPAYKIASWDCQNIPLIRHIARFKKPMIISTGGMTMEDVKRALANIPMGVPVAFLHCTSVYHNGGMQPEEANLNAITKMMDTFQNIVIGYSDHHSGIALSEMAYVMGARIIEKHFTLNHAWKGTDQAFSLEPKGMRDLCRDLKRIHVAMGNKTKIKLEREKVVFKKMGNVIHPARTIPKGKVIEPDDICIKAPNNGLLPYEYDEVIGKIAIGDLSTSDCLKREDLE